METTNQAAALATAAVYERMEGANRWTKGDKDRIYWNNLGELFGVETTRYNSGRISSARLNGHAISNTLAARILNDLNNGKFWFDVPTGHFWSNLPDDVTRALKARIRELAAAAVAETETH